MVLGGTPSLEPIPLLINVVPTFLSFLQFWLKISEIKSVDVHFRLKPYIQNEMLIDTLFLFNPSIFKIIFLKIEKH